MSLLPLLAVSMLAASPPAPDAEKQCDACEEWNRPHAAIHVFGNTWWVGVDGLSVIAIDTGAGLVLLDGALPQSVPLVRANLEAAGLKLADVKFIANSHAHFDHAGGIAALQRATGATVLASARGAEALRAGCPTNDDPQAGFGCDANGFAPVTGAIDVMKDGQSVKLGKVIFKAHLTPGHTPGSTTWTWQSCEGARCFDFVYADSLTPVRADGFDFRPTAKSFRASIAKIERLRCDVLLTPHPSASLTLSALSPASDAGAPPPLTADPQACRVYASKASRRLDEVLTAP